MDIDTELTARMQIIKISNNENVVCLDLSNTSISTFKNGVFKNLINMENLNLSSNQIVEIKDNLFVKNLKLKTISLRDNRIVNVNNEAFLCLNQLEILDLSLNQIRKLSSGCLVSKSLKSINFDWNKIDYMSSSAFYGLPNLMILRLDNNKITFLDDPIFAKSKKLKKLTLNNNYLRTFSTSLLLRSVDIRILKLKNNRILVIDSFTFLNNRFLTVLDLSKNNVLNVLRQTFFGTPCLRVLKLSVIEDFEFGCVKRLFKLRVFSLVYTGSHKFSFKGRIISDYFGDKLLLSKLKLTFQHFDASYQTKFSQLSHLKSLHIECLEPNGQQCSLRMGRQINVMPKLEKLIFKNLNYFTIIACNRKTNFSTKNLKYLDLTGLKNVEINNIFQKFRLLEYLNLSKSEIMYISEDAFDFLTNLKFLYLQNSKLQSIRSRMFENNSALRIIDCSTCCISTIEDFSFQNLKQLETLNLTNNYLQYITTNMFFGLTPETEILLDFNPIGND